MQARRTFCFTGIFYCFLFQIAANVPASERAKLAVDVSHQNIKGRNQTSESLRLGIPEKNNTFSLPLTVTKPDSEPRIPQTEDAGYKYDLLQLSIRSDIVVFESDESDVFRDSNVRNLSTLVSIPKNKVNQIIKLWVTATFRIHENDDPVTDSDLLNRYKDIIRDSDPIFVTIDTEEPKPLNVTVERFPGGAGRVRVYLKDSDLDPDSLKQEGETVFSVTQKSESDSQNIVSVPVKLATDPDYSEQARTITLNFVNLNPGPHEITINLLKDKVGNSLAGEGVTKSFIVPSGRLAGRKIDYPQTLGPNGKVNDDFDAGSRVDTRVVRLYYFRDAHRVVEIINRDAKRLNQTGVDEARRFADDARDNASEATDERRYQESLAVQAAQKTRGTRAKLEQSEAELSRTNQQILTFSVQETQLDQRIEGIPGPHELNEGLFEDTDIDRNNLRSQASLKSEAYREAITVVESEIEAIPQGSNVKKQNALEALQSLLKENRSKLQHLENSKSELGVQKKNAQDQIPSIQNDITGLRTQLTQDQTSEIQARNKVQKAESKELRARKEQFRREVVAGKADPDTYAAGARESIDPVMQVTMTVIGEGVIQLRGPMRGINKIRRMIHQIDTPVGQVKVGIHTIQINGEHGDRMEPVYENIEKEIAHARFLTNQSGQLFRKAVARVSDRVARIVNNCDGCVVIPEDCLLNCPHLRPYELKYMYGFFGDDFMNELCRMKSELLNADNKLLLVSSPDTMSLANAMLVAALADHPIRNEIVKEFRKLVDKDLPEKEIQYYKALTRTRSRHRVLNKILTTRAMQRILDLRDKKNLEFNADRTFHFPNTVGFFNTQLQGRGTLNGMQVAFIRLAQALKAQLIAEMEWKNLVQERSLLEKEKGEIEQATIQAFNDAKKRKQDLDQKINQIESATRDALRKALIPLQEFAQAGDNPLKKAQYQDLFLHLQSLFETDVGYTLGKDILEIVLQNPTTQEATQLAQKQRLIVADLIVKRILDAIDPKELLKWNEIIREQRGLEASAMTAISNEPLKDLRILSLKWTRLQSEYQEAKTAEENSQKVLDTREKTLFSKRLLEQFIEEQEEKSVELSEAMRAHTANIDNYLKRLAIAIEDDVNAQFYNPAFQNIRRVSRTWDVNLGQIETTTILTNNRTFAKVSPEATIEFDLPKRDILYKEALSGAKALATEYGHLMQDSTFLGAAALLSGQPAAGLPSSQSPLKQIPGLSTGEQGELGSAFEKLIPEPSVYKFETGTGFEIKPVIQPDGHSIVYNFNYLYTTNVREPVRADEKHLGRVKRHFVHTDVQTSNYELREVSRYTVALKASRTSRGVPLFEDIPVVGAVFRPLPSEKSSLQQNIILAGSTIYPTLYDLMGLRWSPYADELSSPQLDQQKQIQRYRRSELREELLKQIRSTVNDRIGLPNWKESPGYDPTEIIPPGIPQENTDTESQQNGNQSETFLPPAPNGTEFQIPGRLQGGMDETPGGKSIIDRSIQQVGYERTADQKPAMVFQTKTARKPFIRSPRRLGRAVMEKAKRLQPRLHQRPASKPVQRLPRIVPKK